MQYISDKNSLIFMMKSWQLDIYRTRIYKDQIRGRWTKKKKKDSKRGTMLKKDQI